MPTRELFPTVIFDAAPESLLERGTDQCTTKESINDKSMSKSDDYHSSSSNNLQSNGEVSSLSKSDCDLTQNHDETHVDRKRKVSLENSENVASTTSISPPSSKSKKIKTTSAQSSSSSTPPTISPNPSKRPKSKSRTGSASSKGQRSIGSFFAKVKPGSNASSTSSSKKVSKVSNLRHSKARSSLSKKSTTSPAKKSNKKENDNTPPNQSKSSSMSMLEQLPVTKTPKKNSAKNKTKKVEATSITSIPELRKSQDNGKRDAIMAIVLGETDSSEDQGPISNSNTSKRKKAIYLPDIITSDLDYKNLKVNEATVTTDEKHKVKILSGKKGKVTRDPLKPKSARSSYVYYSQAVRPTAKTDNPEMKVNEISKLIAQDFKELSNDEKQVYEKMAAEDKLRYQGEMVNYEATQNTLGMESSDVEANAQQNQKDQSSEKEEGRNEEDDSIEKEEVNQEENPSIPVTNKDKVMTHVEAVSKNQNIICATEKYDENLHEEVAEIDDDITLGSNDDNDSQDCNADKETEEDTSFINSHEEFSSEMVNEDTNREFSLEKVRGTQQLNKQPKQIAINTLQPRKKVKVNQLQARKKVKVNTKSTNLIAKDTSDEPQIHALQQKCIKEASVTVNQLVPRKKKTKQHGESPSQKVDTSGKVRRDPLKPKSARSSYVYYSQAVRPTAKTNNPEMKVNEISKLIAQDFKELSNDEKQVYEKMAAEDKLRYQGEMINYEAKQKAPDSKQEEVRQQEIPSSYVTKKDKVMITIGNQSNDKDCANVEAASNNQHTISATDKCRENGHSVTIDNLTEEEKENLSKYTKMRSQYLDKAKQFVKDAINGAIEEEDFQADYSNDHDVSQMIVGDTVIDEFKDEWMEQIAPIIQGSPLSLDELSMLATILISKTLEANTSVSVDAVAAKIKLLAARTQYLSHFPTSSSNLDSNNSCEVDIFNDNTVSNMWRWELVSLDLLSETKKKTAKMAQKARKKLNYHFKAILKLIQSIDKYEHGLTSKNKSSVNFQKRVAEISTAEENVLKYEREALNNRIKRRTTMQKEKEKEVQKHKIKEEAEKKLREKAELEAEKDRKKYEASKKQKARMLSFFSTSSAKPKQQSAISSNSSIPDSSEDCTTKKEFDGKQFWEQLGTGSIANKEMFSKLSRGAIQSRRRKTKKVTARVFATVVPENPFEQQPYDEERFIEIWNRNKYLSFHEDFRPPYHGTWTKPRSSIITGRNPFGKDLSFLNYEIDSEAEWEEDDNEQGDDCSNMDNDDDELDGDEDTTKYNYQDGWLAQDGDLALDEDDEETLAIHKNNVSVKNVTDTSTSHKMTSRCIIAPLFGGLPQTSNYINLASDLVEGVTNEEAEKILAYHEGETLLPKVPLCLDLFPPLTENEKKLVNKKYENASKKTNQDMSDEDMKIFAKFVHNCTLKSKELVVEELRQAHRKIISSRAQAHRKLDLIANKRRLEKGAGVIWEVKDDVLKSLGLSELLKKPDAASTNQDQEKCATEKTNKRKEKRTSGAVGEGNKKQTKKAKGNADERKQTKKAKVKADEKKQTKNAKVNADEKKQTKKEKAVTITTEETTREHPVLVSPSEKKTAKKRKQPEVSMASANILAAFLKKKKI